jgi:hypothetical protein
MDWTKWALIVVGALLILYLHRIYISYKVIKLFTILYSQTFPFKYMSEKVYEEVEGQLKENFVDGNYGIVNVKVYLPLSMNEEFRDKMLDLAIKYESSLTIDENMYEALAFYKFTKNGI